MSAMTINQAKGGSIKVEVAAVEKLRGSFRGKIMQPGEPGYDDARAIWNAMIDCRPALIARCAGVADIRKAVEFAAQHGLLTAVRGGGHNIAGNAICDNGMVIDLSGMRSVRIDPEARVAHVEPGATLGDFDREAQAFGLATPLGINSTTGVAGLTLGAGFGWLSRKHGMTIDNLLAADVVTADGRFLRASEKENSDLFWALRGGSGNFGIVTRFEFRLHPLGPEVFCGLVVYPLAEADSALKKYREFAKKLSDDTAVWVVLRQAPPLPFLRDDVHGKEVLVFALFHAGNAEQGLKAIDPVRKFGSVLGEFIGMQPYTSWQGAFDALLTPGARNYWKSHNFTDINDAAIDLAIRYTAKLPTPQCEIFFGQIGGATTRVSPDAMAYSHRNAIYVMNVHGRWESPNDDTRCIEWARTFFREMTPHATGGVYVNFLTSDESDRIGAAYGPHLKRLQQIKMKYDPENLFSVNQNIRPSA
ncbi:MAG: FAD-binding oxidoreductase [Candidatus Zixiibacteriota bacterium]